MIDLRELDETIDHLKRNGSTRKEAEQLALLYIARDHLVMESVGDKREAPSMEQYSRAAEPVPMQIEKEPPVPRSEFYEAAENAPFDLLMSVLDEHMESIKLLYPKEYAFIMRSLTTA